MEGPLAPAVLVTIALVAVAPRYGFHRDELYFMVNADHPAWGYVDHPPLTPMWGRLSQAMFGDSLIGLRVLPALVAGAIVVAVAALTRELGGDRRAATLAAWVTATTATVLALGHMLTTPTLDVLVWTVAILLLVRIVRTQEHRWFLLLGAVVGIGLLNKLTVLYAVASFGTALAVLPERRVLANRWVVAGAAIALVLWAPHLWWQIDHGWPILELSGAIADDAAENRVVTVPFLALFLGPPIAVAVGIGWWRQLRGRALADTRFIALGSTLVVLLVIVTAGKPYYAAGALPALTAVAAVQLVGWVSRHRLATGSLVALNGIIAALIVLPLVPVTAVADSPASAVNPEPLEMIGWPDFVDRIAEEYAVLDDGTARAIILTGNYGEAGAIERYGPDLGLPAPHSGHNSYADVRQPPGSAGPVLVVGYRDPHRLLRGCVALGPIEMPYEVDNEEQGAPLWACSGPVRPWSALWPDIRHVG